MNFPFTQGFGFYTCFGKTFHFIESDRSSRQAAMTAMREHARTVAERRQRYAGRELTMDELVHGIHHEEDRDVRQRIADDSWRPYVAPVNAPPKNPFNDDEYRDPRRPETREQFRKRMAREWDIRHQPPAAPDKEREALVAEAEAAYEQILFNPNAKMSEVVRAEQRVRQAREGDLDHARYLMAEYRDSIEAERKARVREIDDQLAALKRQRDEIEPPVVEVGGKTIRRLNEAETRELDERRRAQEAAAR